MALPGPPANANPCPLLRAEEFEGVKLRLKKTQKEGASKYVNVKIVKNKDGTTMFQAFYTDKDGNKKSIGTFMDERRAAKAASMKWKQIENDKMKGMFDEECTLESPEKKHKACVPLSPTSAQSRVTYGPAYGWKGNQSSIYKAHKTLLESRMADSPTLTTMQLTRGGVRFIRYVKHYK